MAVRYQVKLVDMAGGSVVNLPQAIVGSVAHELNAPGSIDFTVPYSDPHAVWIDTMREVQIWRDGVLAKWGVIVRVDAGVSGWTCQAVGLWWYLQHRVVGKAGRTNWLTNGSFETGDLTGWTPVGVTSTVVTSHRTEGTYAAQLTQDNPNVDTWLNQQLIAIPGNYYTLDADFHIYGDYPYAGPAFEQRGLHIELVYPGGVVQAVAGAPIDTSYLPGHTYHLQTGITVPGDAPSGTVLQVRLYAPGGRTMWDDVDLTLMESLSYPMTDTVDIVAGLLAHAQDSAFGKDDLHIAMGAHPSTLGLRNEVFQDVDHANIGSVIEGYSHEEFGLDFDIVHPTATTRALQLWSERGVDLDLTLSVTGRSGDSCVADGFSFSKDAESVTSSAIFQGAGSGPGRLEAAYTDTSLTGGVVLEAVFSSPAENRDDLAVLAKEAVNQGRRALRTLTVTTNPERVPMGAITVGDRPRVRVHYGPVDVAERMKAVRVTENPNGTQQIVLNAL